jgi:hypothetical protein
VQTLARFLWAELFNRDDKLMQQLGLYASLAPLVKQVLKCVLPRSFKDLPVFRASVSDRVVKFDQELLRIGCGSEAEENFAAFVSGMDVTFAKRLREDVAGKAREAIVSSVPSTLPNAPGSQRVDEEGEEPAFFVGPGNFALPGEMRISRAAREVSVA